MDKVDELRYNEIVEELEEMSKTMDEEDFKTKPYSEVKVFIRKYLKLSDEQNILKKHGRARRLKDKVIRDNLEMLDDLDRLRITSKQKYERFTSLMRKKFAEKWKWK
jgi:hypothetical protein